MHWSQCSAELEQHYEEEEEDDIKGGSVYSVPCTMYSVQYTVYSQSVNQLQSDSQSVSQSI